jgi:hypothetical protein
MRWLAGRRRGKLFGCRSVSNVNGFATPSGSRTGGAGGAGAWCLNTTPKFSAGDRSDGWCRSRALPGLSASSLPGSAGSVSS